MKKVINAFSTPIMEAKLPNYAEINNKLLPLIIELFDNLEYKRELSFNWNRYELTHNKDESGYSSFNEYNLIDDKNFTFFYDALGLMLTDYFNSLGWNGDWNYINSWSNVYPHGAFVPAHHHGDVHWSGVYYVAAPQNCGDLIIHDPKEYSLLREPDNVMFRGNKSVRVTPEPGKFLCWPGYLKHETFPNLSNDDRIIISFNLDMKND